ncbi:serine hydrolase [Paenibacillus campinasensis]|uniref:Serine hydrolase n=2 Tax=Paenibacillus campinasensis TaxID=66347 RepID=A0ABW9SZP7_9BACL|nr:serine hydrolase [Paenibacillus campinasensis]
MTMSTPLATLNQTIQTAQFSGAVLIRQHEETRYEQAYGFANRSEEMPNHPHTRFAMASGSKLFTAVAVCQLVERGHITYNTRLQEWLELPEIEGFGDVTVHHLLTHTSGVADYFDEEVMDDFEQLWLTTPMYHVREPEDVLALFQDQPMKFKPGERFSYSNSGYVLLGLLIERVTGESFRTYIENHIFQACGMESTGYYRMDRLPKQTALGYIDEEGGQWRTNIYSVPLIGQPDGGAYTTLYDLDLFWQHFLKGKLVSEETAALMLTPQVEPDDDDSYGYGIWIDIRDNEIFRHYIMGCDPGVSLISFIYAGTGIRSHVLSNQTEGAFLLAQELDNIAVSGV